MKPRKTAWDKAQDKLPPRKRGMNPAGDPPSAIKRDPDDMDWEAATIGVLTKTSLRLVKQRDGLKDLLVQGNTLATDLCRALGMSDGGDAKALDLRIRTVDWWKACEKAFREFGQ